MRSIEIKLKKQLKNGQKPTICFFDVDGTLFTPDISYLTAPFYDAQTYQLLRRHNIPFVIITGRFSWGFLQNMEMKLYGMPFPDVIIFAGGSKILLKNDDNMYKEDTNWLSKDILPTIPNVSGLTFKKISSHAYVSNVRNFPVSSLNKLVLTLKKTYKNSASVFFSESIIRNNSLSRFSGSIYVASPHANKKIAIEYILQIAQKTVKTKPLRAFIFGDGSIDIPMLSILPTKQILTINTLVHPTPLARERAKEINTITINENKGPQVILQTLKKVFANQPFSPAQNNSVRKTIRFLDPMLDRLVDQKLTANDVSLLGIRQTIQGINLLQKNTLLGIYFYFFGTLADILDGIRARRKGKEKNGQLIDGFADRVKEFYQLVVRAKLRKNNSSKQLQTYLTALSCVFPSIARAQAEIENVIVPEKDSKGGSMIDRTKLLFASLFFQVIHLNYNSYRIDREIYKRNLATFNNRLHVLRNRCISLHCRTDKNVGSLNLIDDKKLSSFQKDALERFLVYVEILQQENKYIEENLPKDMIQAYYQQTAFIQQYLHMPIEQLRKRYKLPDYHFAEQFNSLIRSN